MEMNQSNIEQITKIANSKLVKDRTSSQIMYPPTIDNNTTLRVLLALIIFLDIIDGYDAANRPEN